jgi:hypothetical protein
MLDPKSKPFPTLFELARDYGSIAAGYHAEIPKLRAELDELKGYTIAALGMATDCKAILDTMIRAEGTGMRRKMEPTDTGSVKLADVQEQLSALEDAKMVSEARAQGAEEALARQDAVWARRLKTTIAVMTIGGLTASTILWLITHVHP